MRLSGWICLFFLLIPVSSACTPGPADWWFAVSLSVDSEPSLPGLTVTVNDSEPFDRLRLSYEGDTPVYVGVVRESDMVLQRYRNNYGNNGLSYPLTARFKLVDDEVYKYDKHHRLYDSGTREGGRWLPLRKTTYDADLDEAPVRQTLERSADEFQRVSARYQSSENPEGNLRRDNRSDNVTVPDDHGFHVTLRHGGEQYNVSGTVSYSLNEDYDPWQGRKNVEACNDISTHGMSSVMSVALRNLLTSWLTWVLV